MTSTALTPRQDRFAQSYCGHLNASRAAREAGYSSSSGADAVTGHRLLRNAKTKAAIQALQQAKARELELTRQDVISAVLGAIKGAQEQGNPAVVLRGWVEIARMLNMYDPESLRAEQERRNGTDLHGLSTAALSKRLTEGGEYRNPDGSRMHPAELEAFYEGVTDDELAALAEGRAVVETRVVMLADVGQPAT